MVNVLALIGLVALAIGVYLFVKHFLLDREYEKAEELARLIDFQENGAQNPFIENYRDEDLYKRVFRPLPSTSNKSANNFNSLLDKIGRFARCYYLLNSLYDKQMPKKAAENKDRFRLLIFETEIIRGSIWETILPGKKNFSPDKDPFSELETSQLVCACKQVSQYLVEISAIYWKAREACINTVNPSLWVQTDRIYRITKAEMELFRDDSGISEKIKQTAEMALRKVFASQNAKGPVQEKITEIRKAIANSTPTAAKESTD